MRETRGVRFVASSSACASFRAARRAARLKLNFFTDTAGRRSPARRLAADECEEFGGARGVCAAQRVVLVLRALFVARGEVCDAEVVARLREVWADFYRLLECLDGLRVLVETQVCVAHQVQVVGVERAARLVVCAYGRREG